VRSELVRKAVLWSVLSVAWALVAGATSVVAGIVASSVALVGFGASSIVDGSASVVLVWRFRHESAGTRHVEEVERHAARAVGAALATVATYLVVGAVIALVRGEGPHRTPFGSALAGASLLVLPILAARKIDLAGKLGSQALRSDGVLSAVGASLAAATLLGLALNATLGWWWTDAFAALALAMVLLREARAALTISPHERPEN
jgi:divalent metal cation (Fe/Co/Zn/Cd) transporter